jgi:hypothetical protein
MKFAAPMALPAFLVMAEATLRHHTTTTTEDNFYSTTTTTTTAFYSHFSTFTISVHCLAVSPTLF